MALLTLIVFGVDWRYDVRAMEPPLHYILISSTMVVVGPVAMSISLWPHRTLRFLAPIALSAVVFCVSHWTASIGERKVYREIDVLVAHPERAGAGAEAVREFVAKGARFEIADVEWGGVWAIRAYVGDQRIGGMTVSTNDGRDFQVNAWLWPDVSN